MCLTKNMRKLTFKTECWTFVSSLARKSLEVATLSHKQVQAWTAWKNQQVVSDLSEKRGHGANDNLKRPTGKYSASQLTGEETHPHRPLGSRRPGRENQTVVDQLWEAWCGRVWEIETPRCPRHWERLYFCVFYLYGSARPSQGISERGSLILLAGAETILK